MPMIVLLLVTSLTKIQVFVTTISRFATEISEVWFVPLSLFQFSITDDE